MTTIKSSQTIFPDSDGAFVNQGQLGDQYVVAVVGTSSGGAAILWQSLGGPSSGLHLRLMDASGSPLSGDVLVGSGATQNAQMVALAGGGVAVGWTSGSPGTVGGVLKVAACDAGGEITIPATVLAPNTGSDGQRQFNIEALEDGRFAVGYTTRSNLLTGDTDEGRWTEDTPTGFRSAATIFDTSNPSAQQDIFGPRLVWAQGEDYDRPTWMGAEVAELGTGMILLTAAGSGDGDGFFIGQLFDADTGASLGTYRFHHSFNDYLQNPQLTSLADGSVLVSFRWITDGMGQGEVASVLNADDLSLGSPFEIVPSTYSDRGANPHQLTGLSDGNILVTAMSTGSRLVGWIYGPDGSIQISEEGEQVWHILSTAMQSWSRYAVEALADGGFAITWISRTTNSDDGQTVWARQFDANGLAASPPVAINTETTAEYNRLAMDVLADGRIAAVWDVQSPLREPVPGVDTLLFDPFLRFLRINTPAEGEVLILGQPEQGRTLDVDFSTITDAEGFDPASAELQWLRDGAAIEGATSAQYSLTQADVGAGLSVRIDFTDGKGTVETLESDPTAPIGNVNDAATGDLILNGIARQGETLIADTSALTDADGLGPLSFVWLRDGVEVAGATGSSYLLGQADVGAKIDLRVSYEDGFGTVETVEADATAEVENVNDAPTGAPVLTGTALQGEVLEADISTLTDADGMGEITLEWRREGVAITGETSMEYVLTEADVGAVITLAVRWTDGFGQEEAVVSQPFGPVENVNDAPIGEVFFEGPVLVGQSVQANALTVQDTDGIVASSLRWQWYRGGMAIDGATGESYTPTVADLHSDLTVRLSYTDGRGTAESLVSTPALVGTATAGLSIRITAPQSGEDGRFAHFEVRLDTRPLQPVTFTLSLSDPAEASLPVSEITIAPQDWDNWVEFRVQGLDDFLDDGDIAYFVALQTTSSDPAYDGLSPPPVNLVNLDDGFDSPVTLYGTEGADTLLGNNASDRIHGNDGDDQLFGNRGDDSLWGGLGQDSLYGGEGDDLLYGGAGNWPDEFYGGVGNDILYGGDRQDRLYGGHGNDQLAGNSDSDELYGGTGDDTLDGGEGEDRMEGGDGNDLLVGGAGDDVLSGDAGRDTLQGNDGQDTLNGGAGDDFLYGGDSVLDLRDVIFGGDGRDYLDGGSGNDALHGGAGNDTLSGGLGSDTLIGNEDNDVLGGMGGSDLMFGNAGDDFLNGGFGYDRLNGGEGADIFYHLGIAHHGSDWIQDYSSAAGDVLFFGQPAAQTYDFQVNYANTPGAGTAGVAEAFVIYRPTGQIMWALVDGAAQDSILLRIGGSTFDILDL